ncbi:TlpA disulfide reductase family protein [Compostibacter hankyongensis]
MITARSFLRKALWAIGLPGVLLFAVRCTENGPGLQHGIWRAALQRADGQQVVFNFEVADTAGRPVIAIFNADERMRVDSILFRDDSVFIRMPFFDSYFAAKINTDGSLQGTWTKNYGNRLETMPFHAVPGDSTRLPAYAKPAQDISGSWEVSFPGEEDISKAIGLFQQNGNQLSGTFMTPSGDFRYLQGVVSGDTMKLSGFDGGHALLFTARIDSANVLSDGRLYSINSEAAPWSAQKKVFDSLPAAYAVSDIPPGTVKLKFRLQDMRSSRTVSLTDSAFLGKVTVIQILGSWCPNCMDETPFFTEYYRENRQRGVEFIGIDFERTPDLTASKQALQSFFNRFDIPYPVLFSGVAASDTALTRKVFPELPVAIRIFPTTIFIDRQGYVRKLHSGLNGPATGKYYEQFKAEFRAIMNGLLAE